MQTAFLRRDFLVCTLPIMAAPTVTSAKGLEPFAGAA
jgi:hypothetical protein